METQVGSGSLSGRRDTRLRELERRSVCIGKVGSHEILPPLPHHRHCLRRGLHCGGEGWGAGVTPLALNPSPRPSPHSHAHPPIHATSGERGQKHLTADNSDAHTNEERERILRRRYFVP